MIKYEIRVYDLNDDVLVCLSSRAKGFVKSYVDRVLGQGVRTELGPDTYHYPRHVIGRIIVTEVEEEE